MGADGGAIVPIPAEPDSPPSIARVHALSESGRYGEALALVAGELSVHPGDGELLLARASVLFDWGRVREAHTGFLQAEARGVARTALYLNLAWSCQLLGIPEQAEPYARKAIALDPDNVAAHFGLATILQRLKRYPDAIAGYERVLEIAPDHAQAAAGIARCKIDEREYAGAEDWMRRAIALSAESPQFWINLAVAIAGQERYAESLEALEQAGQLESAQGAPPISMIDTGFALVLTGRYREAFDLFTKGLPVLPDPRAHGYYAFLLLTLGHLREGWAQYEFRWMLEQYLPKRPDFGGPPWAGQDLAGKTILLLDEQGAGDIIHFARFATALKAMGATVLLRVRPEIAQLAKGFAGIDRVFSPPTAPPPFDYHIHLMSIPHVLGTDLASIPAETPYVAVDPARSRHWAGRIEGSGLKIGLAWAGNPNYPRDKFRSIALEHLSDLWDVQGVRYYSLQKPLKDGELGKFPTRTTMVDVGSELTDFADTAAVIAELDLVICVDTAIAHLAGALGKPVWLLLPEIGDFRWLEGREDSPWYPTMRLFRQRRIGEWDEVLARVKAAMEDAVRTGSLSWQSESPRAPAVAAKSAKDISATLLEWTLPPESQRIARVTETRYGIVQYLPDAGRPARSIAWYGEFLQRELEFLSRLLRPGAHALEAGSGVGEHAIALAKMVEAQGHVLVYEARPVVRQILRQNLDANRVAGIVTLMRRDLAGPRDAPEETGEATSGIADAKPAPDSETAVDTVDSLLLDRLDLLKVRSEAAADDILDGASETLWRLRPALFISPRDETALLPLAKRIKEFGYRCWRLETPYFHPGNFNRRDTDIFDGATALALLALPEEADVSIPLDECVEMTEAFEDNTSNSRVTVESGEAGLLRFLRKLSG